MKNRPNILFITTDQQRRDTLGCYGNHLIKTPNLDELAQEGVLFRRAYCESPVCIPSRVTMITGKKSSHHGAVLHNTSMRNTERTIGEVLKENGYMTHFIGKPHFKSQQHKDTEESLIDWRKGNYENWNGPYAGFETVDLILGHSNSIVGHYGKWLREKYPEHYRCFMDKNLEPLDIGCGQGVYKNNIPEEIYSSSYVGQQTCSFIDTMMNEEQPFYCFVSFPDPHWPIMPPKEYFHMYDEIEMPQNIPYNREAEKNNYPCQFKEAYEGKFTGFDGGGHYLKNEDDISKTMRPYWGAISLIDKNIGKIVDKLKQNGILENTIIIFTTDHGEYMGAHGLMAKGGFLYEELINVPFIFSFPALKRGGVETNALLSFTDIVPTLLDFLGIEKHGLACDGISQKEVIMGNRKQTRDCVTVFHPYSQMDGRRPDQHAVITDEWKLIYYAGEQQGELYHLSVDTKEMENLFNKPDTMDIQHELAVKLLEQIILSNDKQAIAEKDTADELYSTHIMKYEFWEKEYDRFGKNCFGINQLVE